MPESFKLMSLANKLRLHQDAHTIIFDLVGVIHLHYCANKQSQVDGKNDERIGMIRIDYERLVFALL